MKTRVTLKQFVNDCRLLYWDILQDLIYCHIHTKFHDQGLTGSRFITREGFSPLYRLFNVKKVQGG